MQITRSKIAIQETDTDEETFLKAVNIQGDIGPASFSFYFEHDGSVDESIAVKSILEVLQTIGGSVYTLRRLAARLSQKDSGLKEACLIVTRKIKTDHFELKDLKAQMGGIADERVDSLLASMVLLGLITPTGDPFVFCKCTTRTISVDAIFAKPASTEVEGPAKSSDSDAISDDETTASSTV